MLCGVLKAKHKYEVFVTKIMIGKFKLLMINNSTNINKTKKV